MSKIIPLVITKMILLTELVPSHFMDYTTSLELKHIQFGAELGFKKAQSLFPQCKLELKSNMRMGSEEELFELLKSLGAQSRPYEKAVVGLTRSSYTRLAQSALANSPLPVISIGATSLDKTPAQVVSLASPWWLQVKEVQKKLREQQCQDEKVSVIYNPSDLVSKNFSSSFKMEKKITLADYNFSLMKNEDCHYLALTYPDASSLLEKMPDINATIIGTGDWNYHSAEIKKLIARRKFKNLKIFGPTGWTPSVNKLSQVFAKNFRIAHQTEATPAAVYAYDGVLLAATTLCEEKPLRNIDLNEFNHYSLRDYKTLIPAGNFVSEMYSVHFTGERR